MYVHGEVTLTGSNVAEGIADYRLNTQGTLLAGAARTANILSANQINYNAKGVIVTLYVSAVGATGGLQVQILGMDPVTNIGYFLTALPTVITTLGAYAFELYPGSSAAASAAISPNVVQRTSASLPRTWYVKVTHGDTTSYSYSVGYSLIL